MMIELHPTFTLEVRLQDRYAAPQAVAGAVQWGSTSGGTFLPNSRKYAVGDSTGCDAVVSAIRTALKIADIVADVRLTKFEMAG